MPLSGPSDGPFYDELVPGHVFPVPPSTTLDAGTVAVYRSIVGEHWAPGLDHRLAARLTGRPEPLVNPGVVMAMAIGASTVATRKVIANLFYRDVVFQRPVHLGETLTTTTEVRAMADASARPGVAPRGKVLLGIRTVGERGVVLDFERCALLPCRGEFLPGRADPIAGGHEYLDLTRYAAAAPAWELAPLGPADGWEVGDTRQDVLRDVVDGAPALVRLTNNLAAVHRDAVAAGGARLVYGGHTVALAQASLERTMAGLATILGWHECNHVGPVREGDLLGFRHTLVAQEVVRGGRVSAIRVQATAHRADGDVPVLDWTPVVLSP